LRTAVWFSLLGLPNTGLLLPYTAQSPTLFKRIEYKTKSDVYDEIERILSESPIKYSVGQSLYYQMPFFCDPSQYIPQWCYDMIEDYHLIKNYNIPIANTVDDVSAFRSDCLTIIESEVNNVKNHKEKNGNS